VTVRFGLKGMGIAPAGLTFDGAQVVEIAMSCGDGTLSDGSLQR